MKNDPNTPLEECLASGNPRRWLSEHPEHRESLAPYLDLERTLSSARPADGSEQAGWEARQRMLAALTRPQTGVLQAIPSPLLRLGTVAAALALFIAATVGAGAFFSGVNPVEEALSAANIIGGDDGQPDSEAMGTEAVQEDGIGNAPAAADNGREHASENAFEGSGNSDQGIDNASDNADSGRDHSHEGISEDRDHADSEDSDEHQDIDDINEGDRDGDKDDGEDSADSTDSADNADNADGADNADSADGADSADSAIGGADADQTSLTR